MRRRRAKAKWSQDEDVELLAHLDCIVEECRQNGKFSKNDVWQELQAALKKRRTFTQIDHRLLELWRDNAGTRSRKKFDDVYKLGSDCMKGLDDGMKRRVQRAREVIKDAKMSRLLATPRQLRSISRNPDIGSTSSQRDRTISRDDGTPTKSFPAKRLGMPTRQRSDSREHLVGKTTATRDDVLLVPQSKSRSRLNNVLPSDTSIADTDEISQSFDTCRERRPDGLRNMHAAPSLQETSESFFYASELQKPPILDYEDPDSIDRSGEQPILDCSHETLRDLFNDNIYFRKKLASVEKERKKLDQEQRLINSLSAVNMVDRAKSQQGRITDLERQLNNQTFLKPFLELEREYRSPLNLKRIKHSFTKMKGQFGSLSIMDEFQYLRENFLHQQSKDADELLRKVLGDVPQSAPHDHSSWQIGDRVPADIMVQSLVGAAVCEWVFQAELRCTAMMNVPLLESFKNHLRTVCGERALRNLDFAAHQSVVDGDHFQNIFLGRTATKLADRLLDTLDLFIKVKARNRVKRSLESIFHSALDVKTQAMIGKDLFEAIWPTRNSTYDSLSMTVVPPESGPVDQDDSGCGLMKVKLPHVPGLSIYRYDRKLVDYCSFTKGDEEELGEADVLFKAVVAIER